MSIIIFFLVRPELKAFHFANYTVLESVKIIPSLFSSKNVLALARDWIMMLCFVVHIFLIR